jgi:hypothetical protein
MVCFYYGEIWSVYISCKVDDFMFSQVSQETQYNKCTFIFRELHQSAARASAHCPLERKSQFFHHPHLSCVGGRFREKAFIPSISGGA